MFESRAMQTAKTIVPTISAPLSWDEICKHYPDEWVCLVEIDRSEPQNFEFRTARVVGHGKTRSEPLAQARPWREHYKTIGHYFTGPVERTAEAVPSCAVLVDIPMGVPLVFALHASDDLVDASTIQLDGEP
jgi:hypothetical protein